MNDSQSVSDNLILSLKIRELLSRNGIRKRQEAIEVSRVLGLSFSHAHRKLKGQSPWTLEQITKIVSAFGESPNAILTTNSTSVSSKAYKAILFINTTEIPCIAHINHGWTGSHLPELVATQRNGQWCVYQLPDAPRGERYFVELVEIRPEFIEQEKLNIAILEDSVQTADELVKYLNESGFNTAAYYDIPTFQTALKNKKYDAFILDWIIGEDTVERCLEDIRTSEHPDAPILVLTGQLGIDQRESEIARAMGNYDVLGPYEKPIRLHVIKAALQRCFNL